MKSKLKKKIAITAAIFIALYFLAGIFAAFFMINCFVKRPAKGWPDPFLHLSGTRAPFEKELTESKEWLSEKNPEQVSVTSFDNLKLTALVLEAENPEKASGTIVFMHGYHSRAYFEFSGFYQYFYKKNYNIILADQRSHGNSEGDFLTFGIKERYDCKRWIEFANKRFSEEKPVYLCGVSMGCSTVLMTLGLDLPKNVKGVIADCGYTSPAEIVSLCIKRDYHLPSVLFMPFINLGMRIKCGYSLYEYSVQKALEENQIPILFVHGTNDKFVPFYMGKANYESCKAPKKFLQTDAGHAVSFLHDTKEYTAALDEFLKSTSGISQQANQ